jgi:hypothetical protein
MLHPIAAPILQKQERIAHGFFTREGGVSGGLYGTLNAGPGSGDIVDDINENCRRIAAHLGADELVTLYQIHSADCLYVTEQVAQGDDRPKADALVTDVAGLAIGALTADCAPILFYGEKQGGAPVIGAAHAGWSGALKGVSVATVSKMLEVGAELTSICAVIGPCIGQASYEVKVDFALPFLDQDNENERFFMAGRDGHLQFDLAGYNAARLAQAGVRNVVITGEDTFADEGRFFSYRRTTHRGEPDYGRQVSAIVIKK